MSEPIQPGQAAYTKLSLMLQVLTALMVLVKAMAVEWLAVQRCRALKARLLNLAYVVTASATEAFPTRSRKQCR